MQTQMKTIFTRYRMHTFLQKNLRQGQQSTRTNKIKERNTNVFVLATKYIQFFFCNCIIVTLRLSHHRMQITLSFPFTESYDRYMERSFRS